MGGDKQYVKYLYYNQIYGDQTNLNNVYIVSYKKFPTYTYSSRKGDHDWTYTYYNSRYKEKKLYSTSYYSTQRNTWDVDTNTPYRIVDFVYSYSGGIKSCTEKIVRNCSRVETKNA